MEQKRLGDLATYINGYAFKPEDRGKEGLPIIRIQDLTGNTYDLGFYNGDYPEKIEINDGDILISWSASLGVYIWNRGKALLNQHIFKVVFDKEEVNKQYFVFAVKYNLKEMGTKAHGATMKHIVKKDFDNTLVPFPTIEKQDVIAEILSKAAYIVDARKQELQKLDDLVRARFVEMFGDIRYEEKYQGIPLRRLCTTISGGTPSTKCSEYYEGNIPWISTVSLGPNYIDGSTAKGYITQEAIDNSATKLIPAGNILFGTRVGVGKSSINDVALCINQDIVAIVGIDKNRFNVLFIKYVLDTYQSYYDSIKKGATILGITGDDLKNTLIPVPPLELQNQFADFVKVVDKSKFTKTFRPLRC